MKIGTKVVNHDNKIGIIAGYIRNKPIVIHAGDTVIYSNIKLLQEVKE